MPVAPGQTVAAALWQAGIRSWRTTRLGGAPRGLFCGIGACFDCLATVDGAAGQRLCVTPARPGLTVTADPVPGGSPAAQDACRRASIGAPSRRPYDVVVVGAGPAGLAAAATAALGGARVALLDSGPRVGGQFWRHRDGETGRTGTATGPSSRACSPLWRNGSTMCPDATVWFVEPGQPFRLHTTDRGVRGAAGGARDRGVRPGAAVPGLGPARRGDAGAAQALLKGSGVAVGREVVVAGAGPFLLPVAVGLAEAGVRVVGVFEAGDPRAYLSRPAVLAGRRRQGGGGGGLRGAGWPGIGCRTGCGTR